MLDALTFEHLPYGTDQVPWDLATLLYPGGCDERRVLGGFELVTRGRTLEKSRYPLVKAIHEVLSAKLARGLAPLSIISQLESLWRFVRWVDSKNLGLTVETVEDSFRAWTSTLRDRIRTKTMTPQNGGSEARLIADLVARALKHPHVRPGAALLRTTCFRPAWQKKKRVRNAAADKQHLEATFAFGHLLSDLCEGLSAAVMRGPLPIRIHTRDNVEVVLLSGLKTLALSPGTLKHKAKGQRAENSRAPLARGINLADDVRRASLLNLRIECELLIFIAQTGMNLAQATAMKRESYRWQTDGDDLLVYRMYKARRGGEVIFRCYRGYRDHLKRYLTWLAETGLASQDDRLFPFIFRSIVPAAYTQPAFVGITTLCEKLKTPVFRPRLLRRTRINWLLRRSRNVELTADQAAHTKETLVRVYEEPNHQVAAVEILRFYRATDPTIAPPGPGACVEPRNPMKSFGTDVEAPLPDCISPEGCLFCTHHRDVMTADYCWKLASHAKLKAFELTLYRPPRRSEAVHPVNRVIDRINAKLAAIEATSAVRKAWVRAARDDVRAGRYHPSWRTTLELLEASA